jgi:hypothetical protein
VSYKALVEFFAVRMTLAAFIAHTFTALRAFALAGFAVVSFDALAIFFPIAVTLVTLILREGLPEIPAEIAKILERQ